MWISFHRRRLKTCFEVTQIVNNRTETQPQLCLTQELSFLPLYQATFSVLTHFWLPPKPPCLLEKDSWILHFSIQVKRSCSLFLGSSTMTWSNNPLTSGNPKLLLEDSTLQRWMDPTKASLPEARTFPWIAHSLAFGCLGFWVQAPFPSLSPILQNASYLLLQPSTILHWSPDISGLACLLPHHCLGYSLLSRIPISIFIIELSPFLIKAE